MARIDRANRTRTDDPASTVAAGVSAGVVAAIVMIVFAMIVFSVRGQGFFTPLKVIGALFMGAEALVYDVWSSVLGLGIHLVTGAFFGVIFALVVRRVQTTSLRLAAGLAYGAVIFLVMTLFILPWANPVMAVAIQPSWFFLYHLAYGFVLPLMLPRRVSARTTYRRDLHARV